jgi:hypothetical protein
MRCVPVLAVLLLGGCALLSGCSTPSWRPAELASVSALRFEPLTGNHPAEDVAMGIDGALLLPSPDGGPPIEVPHHRGADASPRLQAGPLLDPSTPVNTAPGLGSLLWNREFSAAPFHPGVQLYRSRQLKLLIGTRTMIDERYPDAVTTDPRHEPQDLVTAAVVGLRLGF